MIDIEDTIVAIASPPTPAIRGIVRLSGDDVAKILSRLGLAPPRPGSTSATRYRCTLRLDPPLGEISVDVMLWPDRRSYTGQPSAELHTFGSLPILQACLDAAIDAGARAARPGEFTMRAFLAGRLDLTQAEAVLGVIDAEHRGALDHALRQLAGNLSRPLEQMRESMLNLLADVEAGLDFVDEDIEFVSDDVLIDRLTKISAVLRTTLDSMQARGGGGERPVIVLRGLPNAGKSRLLNRLAGREVAIVAGIAGTTRDVVSLDTVMHGRDIRLIDTAGLEEVDENDAAQTVSHRSQQQASRAGADADVRVWCVDATRSDFHEACREIQNATHREPDRQTRRSSADLWVATKSDLSDRVDLPSGWIATSAVTGEGIDRLTKSIEAAISQHDSQEVGSVVGTAARCRDTLASAIRATQAAIRLASDGDGHEFVAAELRTAAQCLGEVTGAVYTDDILDRVFSRFCIGK